MGSIFNRTNIFYAAFTPCALSFSLFAIIGRITPRAVRTSGVITLSANVNGSASYIPRIQLAAVTPKHHIPKKRATV